MSPIMMSKGDLTQAFEVLDKYNDEYLSRMKKVVRRDYLPGS